MLDTPCREWPGSLSKKGYGTRRQHTKTRSFSSQLVHRQIVEMIQGSDAIQSKTVRHECDNPPCFRYDHLVVGTVAENNADRSAKGRSANQKKTHCPLGHPYDQENTYLNTDNKRECRACGRIAKRKYIAKLEAVRS